VGRTSASLRPQRTAGGRGARPRPPAEGSAAAHTPDFPPGQTRVNSRMLSGFVVKIGAAEKFAFVGEQGKYFRVVVDPRAPIITGITGSVCSQIFSSFVAICFCLLSTSVPFHWLSNAVAFAFEKCSQFPVALASVPDGMNAFCERFE